jgi:adenosylmethionine-8-amino-7-oxononanoate aminotransferase
MNLLQRDSRVIWHPYTQAALADPPLPVVAGKGALLITEDGKEIIDGIASWWTNIHGHSHPEIADRVHKQMMRLEHVIFSGFTHPPAVELAERLLEVLPSNQNRIFYSDNGSTAVEIGIKMALQYFYNQDSPRQYLIAFEEGFHGETFGAMSASGDHSFNTAFHSHLFEILRIPAPLPGREKESAAALARCLEQKSVYAFLFEPLIMGVGGMRMYEPEALDVLIGLCRENGVLTIADEVMTGFGRSGRIFASEHLSNPPDILCMSKGLTGGSLPLGATSCTEAIFEAFVSEDRYKTFFHGHSFTGNPVGCAAALASLDILLSEESREQRRMIEERHAAFMARIQNHPGIRATRMRGTILALEFEQGGETSYFNDFRDRLYRFFLERDILLRPLGNIIYLMPPYCITPEQLDRIYASVEEALIHFAPVAKSS